MLGWFICFKNETKFIKKIFNRPEQPMLDIPNVPEIYNPIPPRQTPKVDIPNLPELYIPPRHTPKRRRKQEIIPTQVAVRKVVNPRPPRQQQHIESVGKL